MSKKTPDYIPYYVEDVRYFGLSYLQGLVYGFIRFFKRKHKKFYFSSVELARICGTTEGTINNIISYLTKKGIILTNRKLKSGGGTMRFINEIYTKEQVIAKGGLKSLQNEIHIKKEIYKKEKEEDTAKYKNFADSAFSMSISDLLNHFDNMKTIKRLYDIYITINTICFELDLVPVYNKDTFNATDIMINNHKLGISDIIKFIKFESWDEGCFDYGDLIRNDYYLPVEILK